LEKPSVLKWFTKYDVGFSINEYLLSFEKLITKKVKLRSFQYRLLHDIIFTNEWKLVESDKCRVSENTTQTVVHLLYECPEAKQVWQWLRIYLKTNMEYDIQGRIDLETMLLDNLHSDPKPISNMLCLVAKQYMYRKKYEGKRLKSWIRS